MVLSLWKYSSALFDLAVCFMNLFLGNTSGQQKLLGALQTTLHLQGMNSPKTAKTKDLCIYFLCDIPESEGQQACKPWTQGQHYPLPHMETAF